MQQALAATNTADTTALTMDARAQLPELRALAMVRMGRVDEALALVRADPGPMLESNRRLARGGTMTVLVELYASLDQLSESTYWMRAARDLDLPHAVLFREPRFAELAGGRQAYIELPSTDLADVDPSDLDRLLVEALADIESRLVSAGMTSTTSI